MSTHTLVDRVRAKPEDASQQPRATRSTRKNHAFSRADSAASPVGVLDDALQLMNLPADVEVQPDDVTLWRPTQSEAVFLQFGDLWLVRGGQVVDRWRVDT